MKITRRQLRKLISESIDNYGLVDRIADEIIKAGGNHADLRNAYQLAVSLDYAMDNMLGILTLQPNLEGGVQIDMVVTPELSKALVMRKPDIIARPYPRNPDMHQLDYIVKESPRTDLGQNRKYRY